MKTDLVFLTPGNCQGFVKTTAATYPTIDATSKRPMIPFDAGAVTEEAVLWTFVMPEGYDSAQTLKAEVFYFMASATSGNIAFDAFLEAITPGDAFDMDSGGSFDAANSANGAVPATGQYPGSLTITLTNKDSVAAGDLVRLVLERDGNNAADTASGDCNVLGVRLYQEI